MVYRDVPETVYAIRLLQRLPLGLSYGQIADRLSDVLASPRLEGRLIDAWVDYSGVGRPVYEMIGERLKQKAPQVTLHAITFVHGERWNRQEGTLGKRWMVSHLQAHFQFGRIGLPPDSQEAGQIQQELHEYDISVSRDGMDSYGTRASAGHHFDLVVGLGLATLNDPRDQQITYGPQLY
jgi:hypothetical protein